MTHQDALVHPGGRFALPADPAPTCTGLLAYQESLFKEDVLWGIFHYTGCHSRIELGGDGVTCVLVKLYPPAKEQGKECDVCNYDKGLQGGPRFA